MFCSRECYLVKFCPAWTHGREGYAHEIFSLSTLSRSLKSKKWLLVKRNKRWRSVDFERNRAVPNKPTPRGDCVNKSTCRGFPSVRCIVSSVASIQRVCVCFERCRAEAAAAVAAETSQEMERRPGKLTGVTHVGICKGLEGESVKKMCMPAEGRAVCQLGLVACETFRTTHWCVFFFLPLFIFHL
jgi:hypothetical protein